MTPTPAELQVLCLCVALSLPEERLPTLIAIDGVDARLDPPALAKMTRLMGQVSEKPQLFVGFDMRFRP